MIHLSDVCSTQCQTHSTSHVYTPLYMLFALCVYYYVRRPMLIRNGWRKDVLGSFFRLFVKLKCYKDVFVSADPAYLKPKLTLNSTHRIAIFVKKLRVGHNNLQVIHKHTSDVISDGMLEQKCNQYLNCLHYGVSKKQPTKKRQKVFHPETEIEYWN